MKNSNISLVLISPDDAAISVSFYDMKELSEHSFVEGYIKSFKAESADHVLLEKGSFLSRDDEAKYLILNYKKGDQLIREKVCFFLRKTEMAVVSARHSEEEFHNLIPVFDKLFNSFTFETTQEKVEEQE